MRRMPLMLVVVGALVAASCGGDTAETTTTTITTTTTMATTTTAGTTTTAADTTTTTGTSETTVLDPPYLTVAESEHGTIVTDDAGMSLYVFTPDDQGPSTCTGSCAVTWPPLVGEYGAGPGVDPDLMGSAERADGSMQVTYDGWPLYHYAADLEPGDTRGHRLSGNWWLIAPDGEVVD
jgi:predicted lipoprotein with Yx(FWY)xxD motif